jgi:lysophospholipase L1-like esterase
MSTVWTFGDSLTDGFRSNDIWAKTYVDWKGYIPLTYGEIISKELNYELVNLGKGGSDNYTIFESFIKNIDNIKDDDIVIIGWSEVGRFRLSTKLNTWTSFVPNFDNNLTNMENISKQTIMEVFVNRLSDTYINEVNIWINFITKTINNFKIINWSTFNQGKINGIFVKEIEQITNETNGIIKDAHFSEKGQKQLSEILLSKINSKLI